MSGRRTLRGGLAILFVASLAIVGFFAMRHRAAPPEPPPGMVPASWATFRTSQGHREHVEGHHVACHECHTSEREGFARPGPEVCVSCHAKQAAVRHRGGPGAEATPCLSCHSFAPGVHAPTCIGCHAQPHGSVPAIVQHARTNCTTCHRVHESPSIVPASCTTGGCHRERADAHAAHEGSKGCADCHRDHALAATALTICATCHAEPVGPRSANHDSCIGCHRPHDFAAGGEQACIRCHGLKPTLASQQAPAHAVCTSCHLPHAPTQAASSCLGCHLQVHVTHGKAEACVTCHVPHAEAPRPIALPCSSCHAAIATVDTGAHAGAVACRDCHRPHQFAGLDPATLCRGCHARELALVATNPGHQDCRTCHGPTLPHAPAAAPACASCHAVEQASAPEGHRRCQACHDPHAGMPTLACASCHQNKTDGPHRSVPGDCQACHRPHGPTGPSSPPGCLSCHERTSLPALHAASGHSDCSSCHVSSHEPPRDDRATCIAGGCHADRRDHQPQAQICTGCHVFRR